MNIICWEIVIQKEVYYDSSLSTYFKQKVELCPDCNTIIGDGFELFNRKMNLGKNDVLHIARGGINICSNRLKEFIISEIDSSIRLRRLSTEPDTWIFQPSKIVEVNSRILHGDLKTCPKCGKYFEPVTGNGKLYGNKVEGIIGSILLNHEPLPKGMYRLNIELSRDEFKNYPLFVDNESKNKLEKIKFRGLEFIPHIAFKEFQLIAAQSLGKEGDYKYLPRSQNGKFCSTLPWEYEN